MPSKPFTCSSITTRSSCSEKSGVRTMEDPPLKRAKLEDEFEVEEQKVLRRKRRSKLNLPKRTKAKTSKISFKKAKENGKDATSAPTLTLSCKVVNASSTAIRAVPLRAVPQYQTQYQVPTKQEPEPEPYKDDSDLVNFRGLAMVSKCYASLLEKACILHPELAIWPEGSTPNWLDFAYGKLGEFLFLLTSTRQQKEATTFEACDQLWKLWEEAKELGFELSWLAPSLESVCFEVLKKHLEENQVTLHCQMSTLMMQLCETGRELANDDLRLRIVKAKLESCHEEDFVLFNLCD
ncbi:hypothetical protein FNV43_RR22724 [Rhamnella rubrinervis]|uniref:Uncharacterized protein n=1 Tax=Rhamnella rubrinervis TaxID=2594499 RepID=A0A8K0DWP2_9ROSA|nr:hypothetical protein FNV43_RR22724 [Rhamnella rubrinervis]